MSDYAITIVLSLLLLAAAYPYVMRIRHPEQKPLAAYLIFVSVFIVAVMVLFSLFAHMASALGLGAVLNDLLPALIFLVLVFAPAVGLATWLTRKPPWRQGPLP